MNRRGACYLPAVFWRYYALGLPRILTLTALRRVCSPDTVRGIQVIDPSPATKARFSAVIADALDLIAQFDRIRLQTVAAEIAVIVNLASDWGYSYNRVLKLCAVELGRWLEPDCPELTPKLVASVLVHEATLGRIVSLGVLRNRSNSPRFDLLPCKEAKRFLHRLGVIHTPWDPENLCSIPRGGHWIVSKEAVRRLLRS